MASNVCAHRALTAGLSAGACLAIPAVAFAATIPFKDVHAVVGTAAMPFAIGSLAGMGMLAATKRLISSHGEQLDQAAEHVEAVAHRRSENVRAAHQQGVPVISRAVDALSEEEAWAEIDSLLDSDLSVSCDPIHSKDMYQIALEEIARGTASNTACESTDTFMMIPDAAVTGSSRSQEQVAARSSAVAASVASICPDPVPEELEEPEAIEVPMVDYSGHEDMWRRPWRSCPRLRQKRALSRSARQRRSRLLKGRKRQRPFRKSVARLLQRAHAQRACIRM